MAFNRGPSYGASRNFIAEGSHSAGISRPSEESNDRPTKAVRLDPDAPSITPPAKVQRIASVVHWIGAQIGVTIKNGTEVPIEVNYDNEEYKEELKLTEPVIWDYFRTEQFCH